MRDSSTDDKIALLKNEMKIVKKELAQQKSKHEPVPPPTSLEDSLIHVFKSLLEQYVPNRKILCPFELSPSKRKSDNTNCSKSTSTGKRVNALILYQH